MSILTNIIKFRLIKKDLFLKRFIKISTKNELIRLNSFHTFSVKKNNNLFGEITNVDNEKDNLKNQEPKKKENENENENKINAEKDTDLQKYLSSILVEKQVTLDKIITPLKKKLFDLNVKKNGFYKNNQIIKDENNYYKLDLTEQEIEILEPSLYLTSYRIKSSLKKATIVNRFVRGMNIKEAIINLHFNPKKMSKELEIFLKRGLEEIKTLGYDENKVYIHALWVGSDGNWHKRLDIKGRGRCGLIEHPYIHLKVILKSDQTKKRKAWEKKMKFLQQKPKMFLNNEPLNFKVKPFFKW